MLKLKNKIKLLESDIQFKKMTRKNDLSQLKSSINSPTFIVGSIMSGAAAVGILIFFSVARKKKKQPKVSQQNFISWQSISKSTFLLLSALISFLRIFRKFL
jgi:hypothetical protein